MREDIAFDSEGVLLRGWFYPPRDTTAPAPCVVMAHGLGSIKEMYLDDFAEAFSSAGLAVVVFDFRGWGSSSVAPGQPRQEIDPWQQVRDYQNAITYAQTRSDVNPASIGVWGTSYSAAHTFVLGATDRRIRAVVAQVPVVSGRGEFEAFVRTDLVRPALAALAADRLNRAHGEPAETIPMTSADPAAMVALPSAEAHEYFETVTRTRAISNWTNAVTARSLEYMYGYEPGLYLPKITPTPLLMIVARDDRLAPSAWSLSGYETAAEPKKLVLLNGGHFSAYTGDGFKHASAAASDWFLEHLAEAG